MHRKSEQTRPAAFEPTLYRFAPRLREVEGEYKFGHQCVEVFFASRSATPDPEVISARRSNTEEEIDPKWWVMHGTQPLETEGRGMFAAKLCFRAEDFSARLADLGRQGACAATRNLLRLFIVGGRLQLDVAIDPGVKSTLLLDLGYRRVS